MKETQWAKQYEVMKLEITTREAIEAKKVRILTRLSDKTNNVSGWANSDAHNKPDQVGMKTGFNV